MVFLNQFAIKIYQLLNQTSTQSFDPDQFSPISFLILSNLSLGTATESW